MKKRKLELYITGKLMSALMVGRPAIFSTGGEMYHTAPVSEDLTKPKRRRSTLKHPPPIITSSLALLYSRSSTRADKRWPRVRKGLNVRRMI